MLCVAHALWQHACTMRSASSSASISTFSVSSWDRTTHCTTNSHITFAQRAIEVFAAHQHELCRATDDLLTADGHSCCAGRHLSAAEACKACSLQPKWAHPQQGLAWGILLRQWWIACAWADSAYQHPLWSHLGGAFSAKSV